MIPNTPAEDIWGYRWECAKDGKVAVKNVPSGPPKCPDCKHPMQHVLRHQVVEK